MKRVRSDYAQLTQTNNQQLLQQKNDWFEKKKDTEEKIQNLLRTIESQQEALDQLKGTSCIYKYK